MLKKIVMSCSLRDKEREFRSVHMVIFPPQDLQLASGR